MQTLFAYHQCRVSNQEIAWMELLQEIQPSISPDQTIQEKTEVAESEVDTPDENLDSDTENPSAEDQPVPDPEPITERLVLSEAEVKTRTALRHTLTAQLKDPDSPISEDTPKELADVIKSITTNYHKQMDKDLKHLRKRMIEEVEGVHDLFQWVLGLPLALREFEAQAVNRKQLTPGKVHPRFLVDNQALDILQERLKGVPLPTWERHSDRLSQWYKELKQHEELLAALKAKGPGIEDDAKFLQYLFKSVLWKSKTWQDFFEDHDMGWNENKDIIKSLVSKTLKSISSEGVDIAPLSYQWEDDKQFFEDIFDYTVDMEPWAQRLVAGNTKNWDMDRIAQLDMVLLEMALCEMIKFPSIPVKVTINEYIEISKKYSTPKSKKFINGILDVLAGELLADGTIRKSGRGLIDNK